MKSTTVRLVTAAVFAGMLIPAVAQATVGYFLIGFGSKSRGMGGTGVAYATDGLAAAANPAGMTEVDMNAMRIDLGAEFFNPPRAVKHDSGTLETTSTSAVRHESGSNEFLIPSFGAVYKFNRKLTIGMAAIGAGANTRYDQTIPGNPTCIDGNTSGGIDSTLFNFNCLGGPTAGVQLMQMQMLPSVAYRVNRNHSIGASLALAVQTFRAYGLQAFDALGFAAGPGNLTNLGNDWSYGAGVRVGWLGKFFDKKLNIGLNYASRVYMSKFDKYSNLFAEHGDFDIPEHYSIGFAYLPTDDLTFAFDVQHIRYSSVASIGNPGPNPDDPNNFFPAGFDVLGADNGLGFGWNDVTAYKLGVNWDMNSEWSFRAGAAYAKSPIERDQVLFSFLAPATPEWHATLGASYRPSRSIEWSVNLVHAFSNPIAGRTVFGPTAAPVVGENASIDMEQNMIGVGFAYSM